MPWSRSWIPILGDGHQSIHKGLIYPWRLHFHCGADCHKPSTMFHHTYIYIYYIYIEPAVRVSPFHLWALFITMFNHFPVNIAIFTFFINGGIPSLWFCRQVATCGCLSLAHQRDENRWKPGIGAVDPPHWSDLKWVVRLSFMFVFQMCYFPACDAPCDGFPDIFPNPSRMCIPSAGEDVLKGIAWYMRSMFFHMRKINCHS